MSRIRQQDRDHWTPTKPQVAPTPPAQRDPRAQQCPAPARDHRYQADPAAVPAMFSRMKPGQYQPGETWATRAFGEAA